MEFVLNKKEMVEVLTIFKRLSPSTATNPMLQGTLIEVEDNIVSLTGYNLTIGIKTNLLLSNLNTDKTSFVVNTNQLLNCVSKMNDEIRFVQNEGNTITIISGNAKYELTVLPAKDFPEIPTVSGSAAEFPTSQFVEGIDRTIYAINNDENVNKQFLGIEISTDGNFLQFETIDGFRVVKHKVDIGYNGEPFGFTVKKEVITTLNAVISKSKAEKIIISKSNNHCVYDVGDYKVFSSVLTADKFNLDRFLPKTKMYSIVADTETLLKAIEQASPVVETATINPLRITFKPNNEIIFSTASSLGKGETNCEYIEGNIDDDFVVGVNIKFILDALNNIGCEKVQISLTKAIEPMLINELNNTNSWALVLPVRLRN